VTLDAALAEHAAAIDAAASEPADLERLRHCVLDWLGATLAGAASPAARAVHTLVGGGGPATIVGTSLRCAPRDAALANGVAAHALELDDVSRSMRGHPSAPICAATFALAEDRGAGGADLAAALLAGYDVACSLAVALGPGHPAAGRHTTGTVGTFASAAACGRLLRLDAGAIRVALGLAATQAAGLTASAGTTGKALHAGKAASDGMLAALLAEQGATAPPVEAFAAATGATFDARHTPIEPGIRSIVFKRHACCGLAQESVDAILAIRDEHGFAAGDVRNVVVEVGPAVLAVCRYPAPHDELQAKFSLPFGAAVALAGRDTGPAGFGGESVRDPDLVMLAGRVSVVQGNTGDTRATVELHDGRRFETTRTPDAPAANAELPEQWLRLVSKFERLADPVLGGAATAEAVEHVRRHAFLAAVRTAGAGGQTQGQRPLEPRPGV
jgi:2-methylcitrate dehydratase PrpD